MKREKRFCITDERVETYIRKSIRPYSGLLGEIRSAAVKNEIPVISIETARLLEIFVLKAKPNRILELGTATGFTSILMSNGLAPAGKIDTIEIDSDNASMAIDNIRRANLDDRINVIIGDAADVLENLNKSYDFIFIDAAKGQYPRYYELCKNMVESGGIIFADNVLYRGMTAGGAPINRRQQLLVRRLREYIDIAIHDKNFITDVLPIGDGICISYKAEGQVFTGDRSENKQVGTGL